MERGVYRTLPVYYSRPHSTFAENSFATLKEQEELDGIGWRCLKSISPGLHIELINSIVVDNRWYISSWGKCFELKEIGESNRAIPTLGLRLDVGQFRFGQQTLR